MSDSNSVEKVVNMSSATDTLGNRKLVVLGIPWDVDTEGLRQFMRKYGELSDVIVMKDRETGRSRGFGYVTFATSESAEKALGSSHFLNGRMLDIKVATPKEIMQTPAMAPEIGRKGKRIFVARVPLSVTEETFRSYFKKFGPISDVYMPKEKGEQSHRGIGFVTFDHAESVDKVMAEETHEIAGATVAVDQATRKDKVGKIADKTADKTADKPVDSPYGVFHSYLNAAARLGFLGMPPFFPFPGHGGYSNEMGGAGAQGNAFGAGSGRPHQPPMSVGKGPRGFADHHQPESSSYAPSLPLGASKSTGKRIFVGRIPMEATTDEVRMYFSKFGPLLDVYLPKDKEKTTHRGFGFITFAEERSVEQVVSRSHELRGQLLAIDQAAPVGEASSAGSFFNPSSAAGSAGIGGPGPIRGHMAASSTAGYGGMSVASGYDYDNPWGLYSSLTTSSAKSEPRYRPY